MNNYAVTPLKIVARNRAHERAGATSGACACVRPLPLKLEPSAPSPEAIHLLCCFIFIQLALRYRRAKSTRRTTKRALPSQCATVRLWPKFCASVGQISLETGSPHGIDSCQWHITTSRRLTTVVRSPWPLTGRALAHGSLLSLLCQKVTPHQHSWTDQQTDKDLAVAHLERRDVDQPPQA
jgi:hypothetical protein